MDFTEEDDSRELHSNFVDRGDLRIWEVLTTTYDHENIFESSDTTEEIDQRTCTSLLDTDSTEMPPNQMETIYSVASSHSSPQQMPVQREQCTCMSKQENTKSSIKGQYADTPVTASSDLSQQSFSPLEIAASSPSSEVSMWKLSLYQPQSMQQSRYFIENNLPVMQNSTAPEIHDLPYKMFMPRNMVPPFQRESNAKLLLKPLSPYNYYFRDESDSIVRHLMHNNDSLPPPVSDLTEERMQSLLLQHWYTDPVKKRRRHRKTHGRISFKTLARVIAERWERISPATRMFYQMVARLDKKYYQDQLEVIAQQRELFARIGA
jgi:hypothetical protein